MADHRRVNRPKAPTVYLLVIGAWAGLMVALVKSTYSMATTALHQDGWLIGSLVITTLAFISYFWMNGVKDIVYTLYYHLWLKARFKLPPQRELAKEPLVLLLYCTYNDFNADSLYRSMSQDYGNFRVVILDDSTKTDFKARIDAFAQEHNVQVVRRKDNEGFKAGNLNNFLRSAEFDYFVILDSDEIIPPNFTRRALDYFADQSRRVGIIQANHRATRNRTPFMRMFAKGVDSHWPTYQSVKDHYGFLSLLGHGAMVSKACYASANGFPHVVAEDICFSIAARDVGYLTVFAPDIMCEEEYPPDFLAFRKRHGKWTEGNMEFIRKNTWRIIRSRMAWFEKLDIVLFTYSLPLTALFSLYVIINVVVFPAMGYTFRYPIWMLVPTVAFLIAPMLNDIVTLRKQLNRRELLNFLLHSTLLYGSMYYVSLRSSLKSAFGKSIFHVTPKSTSQIGFREAIRLSSGELMFGVFLSMLSIVFAGSILPVLLLVVPAIWTIYLVVVHHEESKDKA